MEEEDCGVGAGRGHRRMEEFQVAAHTCRPWSTKSNLKKSEFIFKSLAFRLDHAMNFQFYL
jgi:hypothetical protein